MFISSADLMPRNLNKRVELTAPVKDKKIADQIVDILTLGFMDNPEEPGALPRATTMKGYPGGSPPSAPGDADLSGNPLIDKEMPLVYDRKPS